MTAAELVRPYGDTLDDGQMQLSFTLPVPRGPRADEAAIMLLHKMNFEEVRLVSSRDIGEGFTLFVAYGRTRFSVDLNEVVVDTAVPDVIMGMHEIEELMERELGRVVVVGACIGTDAHTVGIDAILNMKGYDQDYGLERYHTFEVHNLGAQVPPEELVRHAVSVRARVLLVSQVVTQKSIHVQQLTQLVELLEAEGIRDDVLLVVGGPYIDNKLAKELGYDAGFGRGTRPSQVAAFIAHKLIDDRKGKEK